jgi:hypothetical protein
MERSTFSLAWRPPRLNQHLHQYLHLLEQGLVVTKLNPINVRFGLGDPNLVKTILHGKEKY